MLEPSLTPGAPIAPSPSLDVRTLLHRVNADLVRLRRALSHDHGDEAYWTALGCSVPRAQLLRRRLRVVANLLHVEQATRRARRHGTRFESLDEQRQWLADHAYRTCVASARVARLPDDATLIMLRAGALPLEPVGEAPLCS